MADETIADVLARHERDMRPGRITPGGNPECCCGWVGMGHRAHVAVAITAWLSARLGSAEVVEAVRTAIDVSDCSIPDIGLELDNRDNAATAALAAVRVALEVDA